MRAKKVLAIVGIVLAVLLVSAGIAVYVLSRPATLKPYYDTVSPATRVQQTRLTLALGVAGVNTSVVVVQGNTVRATYELPPNSTATPDDWQRVVLGAMAPLAPNSTALIATQVAHGNATIEWSVPTAKLLAYADKKITAAELEAAVTKRVPGSAH